MNLAELRSLTRTTLDDTNEPYLWPDEFIDAALNRGLTEAILRIQGVSSTKSLEEPVDTYYSPSVSLLKLPVGTIMVERLSVSYTMQGNASVGQDTAAGVIQNGATPEAANSVLVATAFGAIASGNSGVRRTYELRPTTVLEMDNTRPNWRYEERESPTHYIVLEGSILLYPKPLLPGSVKIYTRSLNVPAMVEDTDVPSIDEHYQHFLPAWARYEAYKVQDADLTNDTDSVQGLKDFEEAFGPRPSAGMLRALLATPRNATVYQRRL